MAERKIVTKFWTASADIHIAQAKLAQHRVHTTSVAVGVLTTEEKDAKTPRLPHMAAALVTTRAALTFCRTCGGMWPFVRREGNQQRRHRADVFLVASKADGNYINSHHIHILGTITTIGVPLRAPCPFAAADPGDALVGISTNRFC